VKFNSGHLPDLKSPDKLGVYPQLHLLTETLSTILISQFVHLFPRISAATEINQIAATAAGDANENFRLILLSN
jgi:hypothetical protein